MADTSQSTMTAADTKAMRRMHPNDVSARDLDAWAAEIEDLRTSTIAFGSIAAVAWAAEWGLPDGHLHPRHYDILARAGARMDSFTRAAEQNTDSRVKEVRGRGK